MMTIAECLRWAKALLPSDSANLEALLLLEQVSGLERTTLFAWPERELASSVVQQYRALVDRRASGVPVAYLLGRREFYGLDLHVDQRVLIPRPETELLVDVALGLTLDAKAEVLDLGTGSGAIALALASQRPQWSICAVDRSEDALDVAKANQENLGIKNIDFYCSDWFASLPQCQFDLIVSNPPYVEPESAYLQQGDVRFEPINALVAPHDGFADLFAIIDQAPKYLKSGGTLWLEHGYQQAERLRQRFIDLGYQCAETHCDLQGLDRVTGAQWA